MDDATVSAQQVRNAPFDLYGLGPEFEGPRVIEGVGKHGNTVNLIELGHGDRIRPPHRWVKVAVIGPLRGADGAVPGVFPQGRWSIDPVPMIACELLAGADPQVPGSEVPSAMDGLLERDFVALRLTLDGEPVAFRAISLGDHWAAMTDLEHDHLLYVISSRVPPTDVHLVRLNDPEAYISGTASAA